MKDGKFLDYLKDKEGLCSTELSSLVDWEINTILIQNVSRSGIYFVIWWINTSVVTYVY
jgi:hypothetical protein